MIPRILKNLLYISIISLTGLSNAWPGDISRLMFIQFMKNTGPQTLCSSTALLRCMNISRDFCMESLNPVNLQCANTQYERMPETFTETEENVSHYARQYSICLLDAWTDHDTNYSQQITRCFGR